MKRLTELMTAVLMFSSSTSLSGASDASKRSTRGQTPRRVAIAALIFPSIRSRERANGKSPSSSSTSSRVMTKLATTPPLRVPSWYAAFATLPER
nr:MAG TPA: hypothetical protein [Caudoviricetes sp.]